MRKRTKVEVGKEIENLRHIKGLSKKELAEKMRISITKMDLIEKGEGELYITEFLRMCVALGVEDLDDLIYEKEPLQ